MLEEIADNDILYRRIPNVHLYEDGTVKSVAFQVRGKPDNSISVELARLTTPQESLAFAKNPDTTKVGVLVAGYARSLGFIIRHDPLQDNPAHCLMEGENNKVKCKLLAEATTILTLPE
ncbi:hypothetical protein [Microcoleus sp. EPA2]|uniref:hypothetical protein n=1 Tax=Microcoleus sp. EPA2 TaxID=2841654 RepID=UPI00312B81AD